VMDLWREIDRMQNSIFEVSCFRSGWLYASAKKLMRTEGELTIRRGHQASTRKAV
jgi:hypothetical protein